MTEYLNDDCLAEVIKYLSFRDQMSLIGVNKRFRCVVLERFWSFRYKVINLDDSELLGGLNIEELHLFHSLIAPHAKAFIITEGKKSKFYDHYLKLEYPQLRELKCQSKYFNNYKLMTLLSKCPQLELLQVKDLCLTIRHLAKLPQLREVVLNLNTLDPRLFKEVFNNIPIRRMYLDDRSKLTPKKDTPFIYSTEIICNLRKEEMIVLNIRGQMVKVFDFIQSFRTLNELYFYADITYPAMFRLIDNNLQLQHLYLGRDLDVTRGCVKWLCHLSEHMHERRQHNHVITIHLDWPEMLIDGLQNTLKKIDARRGHQEPAVRLQKLEFTFSEEDDKCCCFSILVALMNTELEQIFQDDEDEVINMFEHFFDSIFLK